MQDYMLITFNNLEPQTQDLFIALLAEEGYEGFEQFPNSLKAFINETVFNEAFLYQLSQQHQASYQKEIIVSQNWNLVWESNFEPVIVDDFVAIRASFHKPAAVAVEHEIIITPKMSFGTGHHATTWMMMQQMRKINFNERTVFDFGTGTGVLAILSEKMGAGIITAIDIDEWSIENAAENIKNNHCSRIELSQADNAELNKLFQIILANINKNVILESFSTLCKQLAKAGNILFSGLLVEDEEEILNEAAKNSLTFQGRTEKSGWLCLAFTN